jgi:hypothetical protein
MKGIIIGQFVDMRCYVVYTGAGNESAFINKIKNHPGIRFVGLNTVEYPCAVTPRTSVIDNFYISHGDSVTYALQECGLKTKIDKYNVGIKDDESGRLLWSEIILDFQSVLKNAPANTPFVINMSFGPDFTDPDINLWTDKDITDEVKNNYRKHYKEDLKKLAAVVANYQEKDFVIVKSAGNNGLKHLDSEILNDLGGELSGEEFKILSSHLILAGAEDSRNQEYSNAVSKGNYNFLYTSVDISDLKYKNQHLYGTSFAAPRIACFISSAVNEHNIKATDALKAVKDITYRNPGQVLTQKDLEQEAEIIAAARKVESAKKSEMSSQTANSSNGGGRKNVEGGQLPEILPKSGGGTVSSQTWEEPDFWGTDYYTVITKSQFDTIIKDSEKKFQYIGIDYASPYLGTLPRNTLNIEEPYCLLHTWSLYDYSVVDYSWAAPHYQAGLYYMGINGGVRVIFADSISFWVPSMWFRTSSWSKKYLDLLIAKSNDTYKNNEKNDARINKLLSDLYRKGQIVN